MKQDSLEELKLCDRGFVQIDLHNILNNFLALKSLHPTKEIIAVIKADAYGNNSIETAKILKDICSYFAVATIDEGKELRVAGIKTPILILGYVNENRYIEAIQEDLTLCCFGAFNIKLCNSVAEKLEKTAKIHLAINSGMNRIGYSAHEAAAVAKNIADCKNLLLEGIFSHYYSADSDICAMEKQTKIFEDIVNNLRENNIYPRFVHIANSYAMIGEKKVFGNAIRVGIALFGAAAQTVQEKIGLKESMTLVGKVIDIRLVKKGENIGYGKTKIEKDMSLATIGIGYADGIPRSFSDKGSGYYQGKTLPIVGKVCMDMCMLDATCAPNLQIGNEIVFWGKEYCGKSLCKIGETSQISEYELLSRIGKRLPKIFV